MVEWEIYWITSILDSVVPLAICRELRKRETESSSKNKIFLHFNHRMSDFGGLFMEKPLSREVPPPKMKKILWKIDNSGWWEKG